MESILLVEDRPGLRKVYASFLRAQDYQVVEAESAEEARKALQTNQFSLVITDYMLPGANGLALLEQLQAGDEDVPVIIMTAFGEVKLAVEAIKGGAFDFLEKPIDLEYLAHVVSRALSVHRQTRRADFRAEQADGEAIIGTSTALKSALTLVDRVAPSDSNCLLLGESGVGKELFAKRIHQASPRRGGEMISINCASIPGELIESELFGHEKGAFTGAVGRKIGLIEAAHGGTLFLDEIGELPLELQPKLLRVLQTRQFFRVGGNRTCSADVRVVAATNRDLERGIREGWFREDLYYRLASFPITIPPLRERDGDLKLLTAYFLGRKAYPHPEPSATLMTTLETYSWPGNVRELENIIERAMLLAEGGPLGPEHLPPDLSESGKTVAMRVTLELDETFKHNLRRLEKELERQMIRAQLRAYEGNREKVAAAMGFSIKTLYNKIKAYENERNER